MSHERYEEEHGVIERAVRRAKDLREWWRAIEANELMNEVPEREEIMKAMKEMRESAPGADGVKIWYIRNACDEMVQKMFQCRADSWVESVKVGIMVHCL